MRNDHKDLVMFRSKAGQLVIVNARTGQHLVIKEA